MNSWLNKPYPQIDDFKLKLAISFGMGLICFFTLLIFKPFGLHEVEESNYLIGFGMNCVIALLFHYFIFPWIFPSVFDSDKWTIRKEVFFFISIIIFISILNFAYNSTVGASIAPQPSFLSFTYMTASVGILPILLMIYITEKVARNRNEKIALSFPSSHSWSSGKSKKLISIHSENLKEEDLSIHISDFVCAEASNNYSLITYAEKGESQTILMRLKLKSLENQLLDDPSILRCHKSFLINKNRIIEMNGNARSLMLKLHGGLKDIPVSRSINRSMFSI